MLGLVLMRLLPVILMLSLALLQVMMDRVMLGLVFKRLMTIPQIIMLLLVITQ